MKITIEKIATLLLKAGISFEYNPKGVTVTNSDFDLFASATYHRETGELILMQGQLRRWAQVDTDWAIAELKKIKRY